MVTGSAETAQIDSAYAETIAELNRYANYPDRWDGYRAKRFDPEVLSRAHTMLRITRRLLIKEQIIPSLLTTGPASDGSVDVEIRQPRRTLFYTINLDDVEVVAIAEGAAPIKRKIPFDEIALAQWLDWVVGKADLSKIQTRNEGSIPSGGI